MNFYFSEKNPELKNDNVMYNLITPLSTYYFDATLGIFNFALDELITNHLSECQNFAIMIFRINEFFLKNQKINFRMIGIQNINNLCDNYYNFLNKTGHYFDYMLKFNEAEKVCEFLIKCGIEYMSEMNIFDYIFGENIHEGVIQRSYFILSLSYKTKIFNSNHIQILWNLSQTKYQSISNAIIALFGVIVSIIPAVALTGFLLDKAASTIHYGGEHAIPVIPIILSMMGILIFIALTALTKALSVRKYPPVLAFRKGIATHHFKRTYFPLEKTKGNIHIMLVLLLSEKRRLPAYA